jgi:hypothetical protein
MKLRTPLLGVCAVLSIVAAACVVQQAPPANQAAPGAPATTTAPAAAPAPAPATATAAPTATTPAAPAPVADDPNSDIPSDSEDPAPVTTPLPPQQPLEPPPATPGLAEQMAAGVGEGKPSGMEPGAPAAFWIWRNAAGIWKLRTTTAKKLHEFKGRVKGVQKAIGKVKPSRTELGDRITRGTGGEILFRFTTMGHIDGFDFRAPKDACIRFDLQLDSGATAKRVFVGKGAVSPKTNHFIVCPAK